MPKSHGPSARFLRASSAARAPSPKIRCGCPGFSSQLPDERLTAMRVLCTRFRPHRQGTVAQRTPARVLRARLSQASDAHAHVGAGLTSLEARVIPRLEKPVDSGCDESFLAGRTPRFASEYTRGSTGRSYFHPTISFAMSPLTHRSPAKSLAARRVTRRTICMKSVSATTLAARMSSWRSAGGMPGSAPQLLP